MKGVQSCKQNILKTKVTWYTGKTNCFSYMEEEKQSNVLRVSVGHMLYKSSFLYSVLG